MIRRVRAWSPVPIIVLSARTMEEQKMAALDAGADDYVDEAVRRTGAARAGARGAAPVGAVRRGDGTTRASATPKSISTRRAARSAGGELHLTPLEYRVLECLARQAGMIVTQRQLLREAWGPDRSATRAACASASAICGQKLEPDPARPSTSSRKLDWVIGCASTSRPRCSGPGRPSRITSGG